MIEKGKKLDKCAYGNSLELDKNGDAVTIAKKVKAPAKRNVSKSRKHLEGLRELREKLRKDARKVHSMQDVEREVARLRVIEEVNNVLGDEH